MNIKNKFMLCAVALLALSTSCQGNKEKSTNEESTKTGMFAPNAPNDEKIIGSFTYRVVEKDTTDENAIGSVETIMTETFNADKTMLFETTYVLRISLKDQKYSNNIASRMAVVMKGKWEMKGDTLVEFPDRNSMEYKFLDYKADKEDEMVKGMIEYQKKNLTSVLKESIEPYIYDSKSRIVTLNDTILITSDNNITTNFKRVTR